MAAGRNKVLYLASSILPDLSQHIKKLLPHAPILQINPELYKGDQITDEFISSIKDAEILVADPPLISALINEENLSLKFVNSTWAGIDYITDRMDKSKAYPKFKFARMGEGFGELMGEYVIGHIIATERRFKETWQFQEKHVWARNEFLGVRSLTSLNIGILGLGQIGSKVAEYCKSLGMQVTAIKRKQSKSPSCQYVDTYGYVEELSSVLPSCDYICCILPNTPQTTNLLSGDILSCCSERKPVLINIGRGGVIDEQTIVRAIANKWLRGAVLDVFITEPLPETSPLWDLPNVTITPHISGISLSQQIAKCVAENYLRYINGEELKYLVDWDKGY